MLGDKGSEKNVKNENKHGITSLIMPFIRMTYVLAQNKLSQNINNNISTIIKNNNHTYMYQLSQLFILSEIYNHLKIHKTFIVFNSLTQIP